MFLAERILILGFWLFVLISDVRGFVLLVFALAIKVGALSVHLLSLVSVLFFGYFYNFLVILFSVCGLQVASGLLMQTPLGLFVLASGWLTSILLALFVIASGWFTQILLALFVLCYSQWVACS